MKSVEENLRWRQYSRNPYRKGSRQVSPGQPNGNILSSRYSGTSNGVNITKISQREKTFIDVQGNVTHQQSLENKPERWSQSKSSVSVQKIDRRTEVSQLLTLDMTPATRQDSNELSTTGRTKSVNAIRIPHFRKSSIEPERSTSTLSGKIQPTKTTHRDLPGSGGIRTNQHSAPIISDSKFKRSSSVDQIKRSTTASTNIDISRVTIIKIK
jgi:hypothetical protein